MSNKHKAVLALTLASASVLMATNAAWAGSLLTAVRSSCATINCGSMRIRGVHQRGSEPFVAQLYAKAGECLRLDIVEQGDDAAMMVLGPTVWIQGFSDDRDHEGGDFRPLLFQDPVEVTGWYTVVISHFDLIATSFSFELDYGRYPSGNINCQATVAGTEQMWRPASARDAVKQDR